ncbi:hypothetical protein COLO4_06808 [Corchorus olitorius]|uniref:Uncharacterized protein n=1 Tax=Corchorus olitorius TaxID=93759 RepID=A0A1R3KLY6_9ROSI|nr:hypothetical protein COLO4_06808 [Corchorus olitorius]
MGFEKRVFLWPSGTVGWWPSAAMVVSTEETSAFLLEEMRANFSFYCPTWYL